MPALANPFLTSFHKQWEASKNMANRKQQAINNHVAGHHSSRPWSMQSVTVLPSSLHSPSYKAVGAQLDDALRWHFVRGSRGNGLIRKLTKPTVAVASNSQQHHQMQPARLSQCLGCSTIGLPGSPNRSRPWPSTVGTRHGLSLGKSGSAGWLLVCPGKQETYIFGENRFLP